MRGKKRAFHQAADATQARSRAPNCRSVRFMVLRICHVIIQVVKALQKLSLSATISGTGTVVVEAEPAVIEELYRYGFGTEARRKQSRRSNSAPQACDRRDAPIILEEAFFLQHTIHCLKVALSLTYS